MQKEYVALVHGLFPQDVQTVDKPIRVFGRHSGGVCGVDEVNVNTRGNFCVIFS